MNSTHVPARVRPSSPARRRRRLFLAASLLAILFALLAGGFIAAVRKVGVAPRLLGPYLERRSSGHNALVERAGAELNRMLQWLDRGAVAPRTVHPRWAFALRPDSSTAPPAARRAVSVTSAAQLRAALADARAGDAITIAPGTYRFDGPSLDINRAGGEEAPIVVRAERPGTVTLRFALLEGFHVRAPHWTFENLTIVGACGSDDACEHAFHVVGLARGVVIRNNELRDFNAHIKINGADGAYPDGGRIEGNRLTNSAPRATDAPVSPIDLVAASDWHIDGNFIADFVKAGGDFTSYGAFAKGGGSGNRFVRNVVLCEHRLRGAAGRRVGLSFGGGGSGDPRFCRFGRCAIEHEQGLMRDNLIASCSDDGIYVNRGAQTLIAHNTLLDTAGINVRFVESAAFVDGNLLDGPIAARDGASLRLGDNLATVLPLLYLGHAAARGVFIDARQLDLRWRDTAPRRSQIAAAAGAGPNAVDLCGQRRANPAAYGAFEDFTDCLRVAEGR
jgi:hypothetical protein